MGWNFEDFLLTAATGGMYAPYKLAVKDPMAAKNAERAGFDPYSGMPDYPGYIDLSGGATGKFSADAMRTGTSPAAKKKKKEQSRLALTNQEMLRKQANSTAADAKNAVAMKGGLGGGQAERINLAAGDRALEVGQGARTGANANIARISMEDEANRVGNLGQAAGMQANEAARKNAYNLGGYNAKMGAWAGGKQAQATSLGGKK